ncbi:hypothetical protein Hanom_Chr06g00548571 [Helianthus anomalus]
MGLLSSSCIPDWIFLSFLRVYPTFFTLTGLCYNQAMSMLWRVLYTLEQIIRDEGLDFNLSELSHFNFSSVAEQPGTDQRLATFRALDSTVRTFKPKAKDLAVASSTSLTMLCKYSYKELARGPSQPEPKTMSTHAKTCSKRKKPTDTTEAEEKLADLRSTTAAKDKRIVQLEKEANGLQKKIMVVEIEANKVELEAAEEAKICVARTVFRPGSRWLKKLWILDLITLHRMWKDVGTSGAKEQKDAAGDEACGDVVAGGNAMTIGNEGC